MTPNFQIFRNEKLFFLQIWSYFHRKVPKFRKILIILAHFDLFSPDAPLFISLLSPNATGFRSLSLTPIFISYWKCPPLFALQACLCTTRVRVGPISQMQKMQTWKKVCFCKRPLPSTGDTEIGLQDNNWVTF